MRIKLIIEDYLDYFILSVQQLDKILQKQTVSKQSSLPEIKKIVSSLQKTYRFCIWQDVTLFLSRYDFITLFPLEKEQVIKQWLKKQTNLRNLEINYRIGMQNCLVWGNERKLLNQLLRSYKTWQIEVNRVISLIDFWLSKISLKEGIINLAVFPEHYLLAWLTYNQTIEFKLYNNLAACLKWIEFKANDNLQIFNFKRTNEDELTQFNGYRHSLVHWNDLC